MAVAINDFQLFHKILLCSDGLHHGAQDSYDHFGFD
jgi:hypothetical protein